MSYLYTPPTWRNPVPMGGALVVGITTSTTVYRQDGVWHNILQGGMDSPVVADVDVDTSGLLLYFTRPTVVPDSLHDPLAALEPADSSWSDGTLTAI